MPITPPGPPVPPLRPVPDPAATPVQPYADTAAVYYRGGSFPIPLDYGTKDTPPKGFTGYSGAYPTPAQVEEWRRTKPGSNVALRLSPDTIGIDVDAYHGGLLGLAELVDRWGPLPETVASTSRDDGSGIRFYRVPPGRFWRTNPAGGIDIIQAGHRYAIVAPSLHPEGRTYDWVDTASGEILGITDIPDIDDLPDLPWRWIEGLEVVGKAGVEAATAAEVIEFTTLHQTGTHPLKLKGLQTALNAAQGAGRGRHDTLVEVACWGAREAAAGLYPWHEVEAVLSTWWGQVITEPRRLDGIELPSALAFAVSAARSDPARVAQIAVDADRATGAPLVPWVPDLGATGPPIEHGWEPTALDDVLADDYVAPVPDLLTRVDGVHLIYRGRINALIGESGAGKSWVSQAAIAQVITSGGAALVVDLEDHVGSYVARLVGLGVTKAAIAARLIYVAPDGPWNASAAEAIADIIRVRDVDLVVIDSTGEAMSLDAVKSNDDDETARWFRKLPRFLADLGPAVLILDHLPKAKAEDGHSRFAIGSQRKRAAITGTMFEVEARVSPARGHVGYLRLTCVKDRSGAFQHGANVADVVIDGTGFSGTTVALRVPTSADRPTHLMERVSRYVEEHGPCSRNAVEVGCEGKAAYLRKALDALVVEDFVEQVGSNRPGGGFTLRSVKPYRDEQVEGLGGWSPDYDDSVDKVSPKVSPPVDNALPSGALIDTPPPTSSPSSQPRPSLWDEGPDDTPE